MQLISDSLKEYLCQQIVHEKQNANLYLFIAGFFANKGIDKLAEKFLDQHKEETEHSLQIFELLTDLNTPVSIGEIPSVDFAINSPMDIAKAYLDRELITTESLNEIKLVAIEESNPVCEEFMRKMLVQQQAEYQEATTFMDLVELSGNDWKFLALLVK